MGPHNLSLRVGLNPMGAVRHFYYRFITTKNILLTFWSGGLRNIQYARNSQDCYEPPDHLNLSGGFFN